MPFNNKPHVLITFPHLLQMDYRLIPNNETLIYNPKTICKRVTSMLTAANHHLVELENFGEVFCGLNPLLVHSRCDYISTLFTLATNTKPRCTECARREEKRVPVRVPCSSLPKK